MTVARRFAWRIRVAAHVALLGDSIFDNGAYTNGRPDVVTHLRRILPEGIRATLLAVDGSATADLERQVANMPSDVSDVVVSVGGNDAILQADALDLPVKSTADALRLFGERASSFEASYRSALADVVRRVPNTTICTIYNANLADDESALARVGLMLFNDVILRTAVEWHLRVIDLRFVCVDPADFANALEPSSEGAAKIAKAIVSALGFATGSEIPTFVFAG